jgi:hypothetical protein
MLNIGPNRLEPPEFLYPVSDIYLEGARNSAVLYSYYNEKSALDLDLWGRLSSLPWGPIRAAGWKACPTKFDLWSKYLCSTGREGVWLMRFRDTAGVFELLEEHPP